MPSKDAVAQRLAATHYDLDVGITKIFRITKGAEAELRPAEPIKLLAVSEDTVPAGIMPLGFGPEPERGIHYASVIVAVTPAEFRKIRARKLKLPRGWTVGDLLPRPAENQHE